MKVMNPRAHNLAGACALGYCERERDGERVCVGVWMCGCVGVWVGVGVGERETWVLPEHPPLADALQEVHLRKPPALNVGSNCLFGVLDLYWRAPESGDLWYKSKKLKKTLCSHCKGC